MAVKANVLLKTIGEKSGLTSDQIAKLTGNAALANIDIDDDVANHFTNTEFFTEDAAAANVKIRSKIRAEILNGADTDIDRLAARHGLNAEEIAELKKLDKTSQRLDSLALKIAEKEAAKATSSGKDKTVLEKEIDKLNEQALSLKNTYEAKLATKETEMLTARVGWEKQNLFKNLDYAIPEGMTKEDYQLGAQTILDKKLAEKGIVLKLTEHGLEPFTTGDDSTRYHDGNVKISAGDLVKKIANESKMLKTSGQQQPNQRQQFKAPDKQGNTEFKIIGEEKLNQKIAEGMEKAFGEVPT